MIKEALAHIKSALLLLLFFSILTGVIYPIVVTGLAQFLFGWKVNGSIIKKAGKPVGSILIGQSFTDPKYFFGRPSATHPFPYNAAASSASNMGPTNPLLLTKIKERVAYLQSLSGNTAVVPVDLVTTSASGLDPEISPLAAFYQAPRIARLRNLPENQIHTLIQQYTRNRALGIFGEPRVNVLLLNLALDEVSQTSAKPLVNYT